jgi:mevalonate kinase
MSEADTLLTILEKTIENRNAIVQALERIAQRQDENALALAEAIGDNSRALAQLIENNTRILDRIVQTTDRTERMTAEILARLASVQGHSH